MQDDKEKIIKDIDFAKKIKDAESDIEKIDNILENVRCFHHKSDELFEELNNNKDYFPYIVMAKAARRIVGNKSFNQLKYFEKRKVFEMVRDAIKTYMAKELIDKVKEKNNG